MKALDLIFFGRPLLIIPVWTIYLHFLANDAETGYFHFWPGGGHIVHLVILTLIFMGSYIINQIFDIDTDRINDKLHFLPRGIISIRAAWMWFLILTACGLILTTVLAPQVIRVAMAIVILGVLYSVPGVRLKDHPFGGLAANAIAYGILVPWTAAEELVASLSVLSMIPYFLAISAGYILTTIPDQKGDADTGKRTLAVILGARGALWSALMTALATAIISLWLGNIELATVAGLTSAGVIYVLATGRNDAVSALCKLPILLLTLMAASQFLFYAAVLLLTIFLTRVYYKERFGIIYPKLS